MSKHSFNNTKVFYLEPSDFDGLKIKMHGTTLVFVWASYCGHCLNAMPIVKNLSNKHNKYINNKLTTTSHSINIANVQGDGDKRVLAIIENTVSIKGYPTILIYRNGDFKNVYSGARDVDDIESYLNRLN